MGLGSSGEWWERPDQVQHTVPHDTTRRDSKTSQVITQCSKETTLRVLCTQPCTRTRRIAASMPLLSVPTITRASRALPLSDSHVPPSRFPVSHTGVVATTPMPAPAYWCGPSENAPGEENAKSARTTMWTPEQGDSTGGVVGAVCDADETRRVHKF